MEQFRSCPQGAQAYTWSAADSLSSLASGRGVSEQAIRQANPGIDFDQIEAGTSICVPARPLSCPNGLLHTVRAGES
ncbi:LysM domain-containing protein, partial [Eubacteriales bacterium OttesenSCG-928-N13]|nr:LysM domain-containing protein [Eubacteriales bacterium OttesenSCG-928-N13]